MAKEKVQEPDLVKIAKSARGKSELPVSSVAEDIRVLELASASLSARGKTRDSPTDTFIRDTYKVSDDFRAGVRSRDHFESGNPGYGSTLCEARYRSGNSAFNFYGKDDKW